ncbi:SDR family oxidoreductase [Pedobacter glucosidilyticus]|uniref:SDR family oxidoreductase n=1 Tax=Pedobacter glucosidilyticus TaxID=1122941 RepID=UPI0003F59DE3|nr:SDR family oxidoreductase [Pedobacter glucosidilyticus]
MEIWGGLECSINRVGNQYFNQLEHAGYDSRPSDLEAISALGITSIRYPILWEKHQPQQNTVIDWDKTREELLYLRGQNIEVIAGLVHHGSGPLYVDILDDSFSSGLAQYAQQVAIAFPWINHYTPINEPLTTARFCGLYGLWWPHERNDYSFLKILFQECKATVLAMEAIRTVNPKAKLVHTEDLGKTHSTAPLSYQADLENKRRWLGLDLLCGRVHQNHPLYPYLIENGITKEEIAFFETSIVMPDILGFNYYITSERFIDEDLDAYPTHTHGGNSTHQYADIEAVRSSKVNILGPYPLLKEAWQRYGITLALTEVHLHCTREEQMRWLQYIHQEAKKLEIEGVDIKAITIWALLGAFGWDKLLTQPKGNYESGVFDIRSGKLRPTALTAMVKALTKQENFHHPVMGGGGWWKKNYRVLYGNLPQEVAGAFDGQPILILGKTGTLGNAFAKICAKRDLHFKLLSRAELDILNPAQIEQIIIEEKPWAIINTTGFVRVDDAEEEQEDCYNSNTIGCKNLAILCKKHRVKLLTFSSDLVFDGVKNHPYTEDDEVNPLNIYGKSKAHGEHEVLQHHPNALVIRSSTFFGPWDEYNYVYQVINCLKAGLPFIAPHDVMVSPTYVPDLVNTSLDVLIDNESGIWHLANVGAISFAAFALLVAKHQGLDESLIIAKPIQEINLSAKRPSYSVLASKHGCLLPTLNDALERYFQEAKLYDFMY